MFNALAGPARMLTKLPTVRPRARPILQPFRALHASSSNLRKAQEIDLDFEDEDASASDDLFGSDLGTTSDPSSTDTVARNREIRDTVFSIVQNASLPRDHFMDARRARTPVPGTALTQYIQACENGEELKSLKPILRGWRVMGRRVKEEQAHMIIERCINAGESQLAVELLNDKLSYGLVNVSPSRIFRLCLAVLESSAGSSVSLPQLLGQPRHSIALSQLVLDQRTSPTSQATPIESEETSAAIDDVTEASEGSITPDSPVEQGNSSTSTTTSTSMASIPLPEDMTEKEVELINTCFAMIDQAGGDAVESAAGILDRTKWGAYLQQRGAN